MISVAGLLLVGFIASWWLETETPQSGQGIAAEEQSGESLAVGQLRNAVLDTLTIKYRSRYPERKLQIVHGKKLAPLKFLNGELKRQGASWRVELEKGRLDFYEVT